MTLFYVIRHAEAEGNLYRRIHGWYDSLITENGYRQIAALQKRFEDVPIDAVYSSDLFRTMTTAGAIYHSHGLALNTRRDLREIHLGAWEDLTWGDAARRDVENMLRFNHSAPDFRVSGAESFAQVQVRMKNAILDLAQAHPDQTVAVFSHGTAIRCLQGAALGLGPGEMDQLGHSDNTAVTCLEVENGQIRVVFADDSSHLPLEISTLARQRWWKKKSGDSDTNLWFRPLNMAQEERLYLDARHEMWQDVHGAELPFDGAGFVRAARHCWEQDRERAVMAVMLGDTVAGVLEMDPERFASERVGYIPFVYMGPQTRKKGMGVQLIGQAVSYYRSLGRDRLRLRCSPENDVAQRFYQRYGFHKAGEERGALITLDILEKYIGYERQ